MSRPSKSCGASLSRFRVETEKPAESGFRRRENGGVVGHWQGEVEGDGWRRGRERAAVPNEGGWGRRRCARQIEHPRRDNIITARVLWGVRARWYDMRATSRRSTQRGSDSRARARDSILPVKERERERDIVPASSLKSQFRWPL